MALALETAAKNPIQGGWMLCSRMSTIEVFTVESYDGAGKGLISADGISRCEEREGGGGEKHQRRVNHPAREKVVLSSERSFLRGKE